MAPWLRGSVAPWLGEIRDYFLFPAGKLKVGVVPLERATKAAASYESMREMFVAVERHAGVQHVQGRAFYGLRRQATDLPPEFAQDARVLNHLSGHADSATRERIYHIRTPTTSVSAPVPPRRGATCGTTLRGGREGPAVLAA